MEFDLDDINLNNFKLPNKKLNIIDDNVLFNKSNISKDLLNMSSSSSKISSKSNSLSNSIQDTVSINSESSDNSDSDESISDRKINNINKEKKNAYTSSRTSEILEKKEILYQFDRLRSKGVNVPYSFTMNSDLNEMRTSYERIKREKEIDASVRFQRKMMMGFVTGFEFLNNRYDPFTVELNGWSEQVHETLDDYDDIFEELHEKYNATGSDMAPELRLMISLGGSAFMFHLTKRMFSNSKLPKVEEVLQKNPELMRKFQEASAMEYINGNRPQTEEGRYSNNVSQNTGDIFSMVSGLFSNNSVNTKSNDIDNIINNVHSQINIDPQSIDNMMETLTVTDDEITSLIEETIDINLNPKKKKYIKKNLNKKILSL